MLTGLTTFFEIVVSSFCFFYANIISFEIFSR